MLHINKAKSKCKHQHGDECVKKKFVHTQIFEQQTRTRAEHILNKYGTDAGICKRFGHIVRFPVNDNIKSFLVSIPGVT